MVKTIIKRVALILFCYAYYFVVYFRSQKSPIPQKRIQNIIEFMTYEVYKYACRGLYECDKLTYTLLLALKIDLASNKIKREEFSTLIKGKNIFRFWL